MAGLPLLYYMPFHFTFSRLSHVIECEWWKSWFLHGYQINLSEEFYEWMQNKKNVCQINCVEFSHAIRKWMLNVDWKFNEWKKFWMTTRVFSSWGFVNVPIDNQRRFGWMKEMRAYDTLNHQQINFQSIDGNFSNAMLIQTLDWYSMNRMTCSDTETILQPDKSNLHA